MFLGLAGLAGAGDAEREVGIPAAGEDIPERPSGEDVVGLDG